MIINHYALADCITCKHRDLRPASLATDLLSDGELELSSGDESDNGDSDWSTDYADTVDGARTDFFTNLPRPDLAQMHLLSRHGRR